MDNTKAKILLLDDEANTLKVISAILRKNGYEVFTSMTAEEAMGRLTTLEPDTVIADYKLPGMNGVEFMEALKRKGRTVPVVMLTAHGTIEKAVDAMKRGAFMYLAKPVNPDELLTVTREAVEKHRLVRENLSLRSQLKERYGFRNLIGKSPAMQEIFALIETVSKSASNVLIMGGSGTGKELVARAIHYESPRAEGPFVTLDCAALPEELLESEIFGHEKGSFTGAYEKKIGQIELSHKGTLFLDEVGELSLNIQKKFLRFLQEREIMRIGGKQRIKVDVRIIAATNRDLQAEVKKGNFREDLFYRLHVVTVHVPPLKNKKEDIPLLVSHFLRKFNEANGKAITGIDSTVIEAFMNYEWPGNVRELENAMERAVVLCPVDTITLRYLPRPIREQQAASECPTDDFNLFEAEKRLLLRVLEKTGWNQSRSAEVLGISRKQLRTRMRNHGLLQNGEEQP